VRLISSTAERAPPTVAVVAATHDAKDLGETLRHGCEPKALACDPLRHGESAAFPPIGSAGVFGIPVHDAIIPSMPDGSGRGMGIAQSPAS
jgi:hypothetical protein